MVLLMVLALFGCGEGESTPATSAYVPHGAEDDEPYACGDGSAEVRALYWQVWDTLNHDYPYFEYKAIDWLALGDTCEIRVCADDAGYNDLVNDAMECLLGPLRDHHVAILDRQGTAHQYGVEGGDANSDAALTAELLDAGSVVESAYTMTGTLMDGRFGYVRVDTWSRSGLEGVDVGGLVDQVGEVSGFVVDARSNGGGDPYIAAELVGRFTSDAATAYAYYQMRVETDDDPSTHELSEPGAFTLGGSVVSAEPFGGKVAVLLGENCASACEHLAAMFDTVVPASRSFGATTLGASGWPVGYDLDDAETLLYSSTVSTTLPGSGLPIEWNGIRPDELVAFRGDGDDEVLAAAVMWLQAE